MKCVKCERENADTAKFCRGCGAALISDQVADNGQLPMVKFSAAVEMGIRRYRDFQGRSTRAEYWWFTLFCVIGIVLTGIIDSAAGTETQSSSAIGWYFSTLVPGFFGGIWALATLIPSLAVGARRLHDINRSAWWLLLEFTIIGAIPLIIWAIQQGDKGDNEYGADPRQAPLA